jgi:hypothetical protein
MADNEQETIQCSRCKKRFFADDFKVTRLGRRLKTCLECNARGRAAAHRHQARRDAGTLDLEHGKICKRDPTRIDMEARKYGVKLVDPDAYKNANTRVEWECLTPACKHRFEMRWSIVNIRGERACNSYFHNCPHYKPYWLNFARARGLNADDPWNQQEAVAECEALYKSENLPMADDGLTELLADFGF